MALAATAGRRRLRYQADHVTVQIPDLQKLQLLERDLSFIPLS